MVEPMAPTNSALLDKLRTMRSGGGGAAMPQRPVSLPGGGPPTPTGAPTGVGDLSQPMGNKVAFHLMQATNELVRGGPDNQENKAAVEMFMMSLVEIFDTSGLQAPPGQALGPEMGQPSGMPPMGSDRMAPPMGGPLG